MALEVISDHGTGRPFVVVQERGAPERLVLQLVEKLRGKTRTIHVRCGELGVSSWRSESSGFEDWVGGLGVAQVSVVAFGAATILAQGLALQKQKVVRALVLVDPTCRPHPTAWDTVIGKIESLLPLGLPFRRSSPAFDSAAFLQRIRCPTLLVATAHPEPGAVSQVEMMSRRLPTSWLIKLDGEADSSRQLAEMVVTFSDFPAKCPQRVR